MLRSQVVCNLTDNQRRNKRFIALHIDHDRLCRQRQLADYLGQTLSAEVDRARIGEAESLNLTLSVDQQADVSRIDLSPLDQDWQVLSRSSQSSVQMVNGRTTATSHRMP